jgi:hypothetical protein
VHSSIELTTEAIGTVIGRKTTINKKDYRQIMLYIPSDISLDSLFRSLFEIGKPIDIKVDGEKRQMVIKPIAEKEALGRGWVRRDRTKRQRSTG